MQYEGGLSFCRLDGEVSMARLEQNEADDLPKSPTPEIAADASISAIAKS